ncbi:hypothetical protein GCM10023340_22050 [Nocardioides marinquilinus]|uniref:Uncharacterized protein n=1 Tax=Nocardioides marinquilinus TaxID=1210400 RepID=A0ABP9PP56_9ACTN
MGGLVEYTQERKGFWREPEGTPTSEVHALEAWVPVAHELLGEAAEQYHGHLSPEEFGQRLQLRSGVHTTRPPEKWLDKVLAPVAAWCERSDQPPLTSLVVLDPRHDDIHAARLRLECYRWAGSAPEDGGVPAPLTPARAPRARAASRPSRVPGAPRTESTPRPTRTPRVAASDKPVNVCPTCFMALPATGVCDNCD